MQIIVTVREIALSTESRGEYHPRSDLRAIAEVVLQGHEIAIKISRNDDAEDWSIENQRLRHERVSAGITETLDIRYRGRHKCRSKVEAAKPLTAVTLNRDQTEETCLNVLEFAVPKEAIEVKSEVWNRKVFESNKELSIALKRIRDSYCMLLAGKSVKNADEILAQVRVSLTKAEREKTVV
jgi:hypothetical protein